MNNRKKLTILHSNDLHGDFMAEQQDEKLLGGVSMLSGYIQKVRKEEKNVLYTISGDMFRGSLIDSEYKGLSTIEIMNLLTPNVATIGNHEVDYGIAHLLFLEKCARFPIINANIYIKTNNVRLFRSHVILEVEGMKILFIGILTEEVLHQTKQEAYIGSFVDVREAAQEVGKICDSYRREDIDFTVLLTHIGIEADEELAKLLDPNWGVDLIIGGHSHTLLEEPRIVAGIPIVQAASGTDQIGRFDIVVDTDNNCIDSFQWQLIPIEDGNCPRDLELEKLIHHYKEETDKKYQRYITRLAGECSHPSRTQETPAGRLFADLFRDHLGLDVMLVASGGLRKKSFGPVITYQELLEMHPFDDKIVRVTLTGAQLKRLIRHIFLPGTYGEDSHREYYQFSRDIRFVYDRAKQEIRDITFGGKAIDDEQLFNVGMEKYHMANAEEFFGLSQQELEARRPSKLIVTSALVVLEEWLGHLELLEIPEDERWVMV